MVDPVEGPGGPGPAGQELRLPDLPPEMLEHMMEFMEPQTLSTLRDTEELQAQVDHFLEHLINSGKLTDRQGNRVRPGLLEPSEVLQNWANDYLIRDYQPPSEADVAAKVQWYDQWLTPMGLGTPAEEFQSTLTMYDDLLAQGGRAAQALEDELHIYVQALLREGRIVDAADNPLPPDTDFWAVWEGLHTGDAIWISPEPTT